MSPRRLPSPGPSGGQVLGNQPLGTYYRLKRYFFKRCASEIKVIGATEGGDLVGAGGVEGGRKSGVLVEEAMGRV